MARPFSTEGVAMKEMKPKQEDRHVVTRIRYHLLDRNVQLPIAHPTAPARTHACTYTYEFDTHYDHHKRVCARTHNDTTLRQLVYIFCAYTVTYSSMYFLHTLTHRPPPKSAYMFAQFCIR